MIKLNVNNIILHIIVVLTNLLFTVANYAIAVDNVTCVDNLLILKEEPYHITATERITSRLTHAHYRKFDFNQNFSNKIFDRYLHLLDYNHNVLIAKDVDQFNKRKNEIGDELRSGKLDLFYDIYNFTQKRRFERYQYALNILKHPMDFSSKENFNLDRSKASWPKDIAELNVLWNMKIKYDELKLKLTGKKEKEIRNILISRYKFAIYRLTKTNSEEVFSLAMNSFVHEIDPHTNYLSPYNAEQFNTEINLSLEGIGAVLQADDDYIVINSIVAGSPASKNKNINVGDRIVSVGQIGQNMVDITGWQLEDVVTLIKGPKGSKVRLKILPASKGAEPCIVTLTREYFRLEDRAVKFSVKTIDKKKVGILKIPGFYIGLTNDVKIQLQKLKKQNIDSIIVDLRNNRGGVLSEAVLLSGIFIPSGPIVLVRNNNGKIYKAIDADGIVYYEGSLVVLVDRFSASASEIFAAAMQDYGRALIVGESTFGKGTVQQYHSLNRIYDKLLYPNWPTLGSIQYTIQKFYRINGDSIQRKGVTPDVIMLTSNEEMEIGEKFEDNALPWDSISPVSYIRSEDIMQLSIEILRLYKYRIANNPEFQYIMDDVVRLNNLKYKKNIVSLNYAQRKKENEENNIARLARINARFKREGKPLLKKLTDLPKDYQEPDPYLDETVHIAIDLANLEKDKQLCSNT